MKPSPFCDVNTLFTEQEGTKSVKYMESKNVEDTPSALAHLIFLADDQPFNPSFQPTVSTQASPKVIRQGDSISDTVTSGVSGDAKWIDGTNATAKGFLYYAGTKKSDMSKIDVKSGETPADYKARVDKTRGSPVATATAIQQKLAESNRDREKRRRHLGRRSKHSFRSIRNNISATGFRPINIEG